MTGPMTSLKMLMAGMRHRSNGLDGPTLGYVELVMSLS